MFYLFMCSIFLLLTKSTASMSSLSAISPETLGEIMGFLMMDERRNGFRFVNKMQFNKCYDSFHRLVVNTLKRLENYTECMNDKAFDEGAVMDMLQIHDTFKLHPMYLLKWPRIIRSAFLNQYQHPIGTLNFKKMKFSLNLYPRNISEDASLNNMERIFIKISFDLFDASLYGLTLGVLHRNNWFNSLKILYAFTFEHLHCQQNSSLPLLSDIDIYSLNENQEKYLNQLTNQGLVLWHPINEYIVFSVEYNYHN